jgi:hypothetical protein
MPSAQGMSNRAMGSLSAVSGGMFAFLSSAAAAFTPPLLRLGGVMAAAAEAAAVAAEAAASGDLRCHLTRARRRGPPAKESRQPVRLPLADRFPDRGGT